MLAFANGVDNTKSKTSRRMVGRDIFKINENCPPLANEKSKKNRTKCGFFYDNNHLNKMNKEPDSTIVTGKVSIHVNAIVLMVPF